MAAQAAAVRRRRILRNAQTNADRLRAADKALGEGDVRLACRVYLRVAADRSLDSSVQTARQRLAELKTEATARHTEVLNRLAKWLARPKDEPWTDEEAAQVSECMSGFAKLAKRYGEVPGIGKTIKSTLSTHLKKPQVRAAINEPIARRMLNSGRQLEAEDHVCCAMQAYEEAVAQLPAPSAQEAQRRLQLLSMDPENVKAADICRDLKWCHRKYRLAELLAKGEPDKACELFGKIIERSPADSAIHSAAEKQLALLK